MIIRNEAGLIEAIITEEYALGFQLLDKGYPLPVDLEMELEDQGYDVAHLYAIHEMDQPLVL